MKIALVMDEIYLPSFGGGIKANRYLLEELARNGHACTAFTRALTRSPDGPNNLQQFTTAIRACGADVAEQEPNVFTYTYQGVRVEAHSIADQDEQHESLVRRIRVMQPDWILVADDKRRIALRAAMLAAPARVILLLQTIIQLPFGPLSIAPSREYAELVGKVRAIVVISEFMQHYIRDHGGLDAHLLRMPVFGTGPFPDLAHFESGFVTLVNPCELKGLDIFTALARRFPDVAFAAVPTWGASPELIERLQKLPNVQILQASDNIEDILRQTRVLLVPSLWPETFGYVAPEAMLRGIPVLASNIGGLPEAKLGVDYVLPVTPGEFRADGFYSPPQDVAPWSAALEELLSDESVYLECSQRSRQAAHEFVNNISVSRFEALLDQLEEDR